MRVFKIATRVEIILFSVLIGAVVLASINGGKQYKKLSVSEVREFMKARGRRKIRYREENDFRDCSIAYI